MKFSWDQDTFKPLKVCVIDDNILYKANNDNFSTFTNMLLKRNHKTFILPSCHLN